MEKKTVVICGAGADRAAGMPLASELIPKITEFLNTEDGKAVDKSLRDALPYLRFMYSTLATETVQNMLNAYRDDTDAIVESINYELNDENINASDKHMGRLIINILIKIQGIQRDVRISPEIKMLLNEGGSQQNLFPIDDFDVIDLSRASFTGRFNELIHNLLDTALRTPNHRILRHLTSNLINFERLLTDSFFGIYTNDVAKIKRYIYQAWTLWAFLKHQEEAAYSKFSDGKPLPFYSSLPNDWEMITLNYTSFAQKSAERTGGNPPYYFHGELSNYTRMLDGVKCSMDENIDPVEFIKSTVANEIRFEKEVADSYSLPCIIPPLKCKPALTGLIDTWGFIDVWHKSKEILDSAARIVIVGYSFNYADEHLNDIIRDNKDKDILIVDKHPRNIRNSVQNIFSCRPEEYVVTIFQGMDCYRKNNLRIVEAEAEHFDWSKI